MPFSSGRRGVAWRRRATASASVGTSTGPGPNAPAWSGKTVYPEQTFAADIPDRLVSSADAAGFLGYQGIEGGITTWPPQRVFYPTLDTPLGTKRCLQVRFPGSTTAITGLNQTTSSYPIDGGNAGAVLITGTWSGTLAFEVSDDGVSGWTPFATENGGAITSTTANGEWYLSQGTWPKKFVRVRASSWTSGTASVRLGMRGGGPPANFTAGNFTGNPTRVYTRIVYRVSSNWSDGGNAGTKFFFFSQEQGNNHYFSRDITIDFQDRPGASGPQSVGATVFPANGEWADVEILMEANTAGATNGKYRLWINGVLQASADNLMYFLAATTPRFLQFVFVPTYGGGEKPPPDNITFDIAYWYRESAA